MLEFKSRGGNSGCSIAVSIRETEAPSFDGQSLETMLQCQIANSNAIPRYNADGHGLDRLHKQHPLNVANLRAVGDM